LALAKELKLLLKPFKLARQIVNLFEAILQAPPDLTLKMTKQKTLKAAGGKMYAKLSDSCTLSHACATLTNCQTICQLLHIIFN